MLTIKIVNDCNKHEMFVICFEKVRQVNTFAMSTILWLLQIFVLDVSQWVVRFQIPVHTLKH